MKRVWKHVLNGAAMLSGMAVVGSVGSACVHDDSTIFISMVLAAPQVTPGMTCLFTADPTQPHITFGALDADLSQSYSAVFLVGNQIVPRGDPNQPQTETSYVTIDGAVVRILDSSGNQVNTYTFLTSVTIPPSSGTTPGYSTLPVTILDSQTVSNLDLPDPSPGTIRLVPYVRVFGHTLGGDSVESDEFAFPVDVCRSCLISFPSTEESPSLPSPNCANSSASGPVSTTVPCIPGQDTVIDCGDCQGVPACDINEK